MLLVYMWQVLQTIIGTKQILETIAYKWKLSFFCLQDTEILQKTTNLTLTGPKISENGFL